MITVSFASANPDAETVISYVPGERLPMVKEPSSFAVVAFVSPFPVFLIVICAFAMGELENAAIFPERDLPTTCASIVDDVSITNAAIAPLSKKTIFLFISERETMD